MKQTKYRPPSIDNYGGITAYLNAKKSEHNGYGANDIKRMWNWGAKPHASIASIAVMYSKSWVTINDWINRLHKEAGIERPDA